MRTVTLFNDGWRFIQKDVGLEGIAKAKMTAVTVPHTWNNLDGQDGGDNYYRGRCWYEKSYVTPKDLGSDRLYLDFAGVSSIAEVYVNGTKAITHEGGFSRFRCDITGLLNPAGKKNSIVVSADTSENERVYPQVADFTFFGGIYRDVNLLRVNESHFDLDYLGGPGIAVNAKPHDGIADVEVRVYTTNVKDGMTVKVTLTGDNAGEAVTQEAANGTFTFKIDAPHLWHGRKDPYLYKATAELIADGKVIDTIETAFGVRSFRVDPNEGFFLNGEAYHLHGVSRHQDRENKGWAIGKAEHEEDMELIKEVGATTIRLAHYQHDEYFYQLCDKNGMVIWAEIPYISRMLPDGHPNEISQMKELIVQNYNHPSIVCWGLSNEITISGETEELYTRHRTLNQLCHEMDPDRLTTMAQVSMLSMDSPLNNISDIISYNHYFGWYAGEVADNGPWFDEFHEKYPNICLGVSEYGCEAILTWHTDKPEQGDYSEEYQAYYHEEMLKTFATRPFLWSTHVWNMFDFASDMRDEGGRQGRNHKGLVTFDRKTKKDSFFCYKAFWSDVPFVHVAGRRYFDRPGKTTDIKVYSNQPEVELFVNGKSVGKQQGDKIFVFKDVALKAMGKTTVKAVAGSCTDEIKLHRVSKPNKAYSLDAVTGEGVANWFDSSSNDGCFSVKDKIGAIMDHPEGAALMDSFMAGLGNSVGGGFDISAMGDGMIKMMRNMTVERIIKMAGDRIPADVMKDFTDKLCKIKK